MKPLDEVLVPSLSFVAPANAILYLGATPHFVDSEINHFGMLDKNDPSKNGKLILDFEIIFPETLTEEQKKTIAYVL